MLRGIRRQTDVATFFIGGLAASELMWIVGMENKKTDYDRKTKAQITITRDIIERLKRGEKVDVQKELLQNSEQKEETVNSILSSLEEMDTKWGQSQGISGMLTQPGTITSPAPKTSNLSTKQPENTEEGRSRWL